MPMVSQPWTWPRGPMSKSPQALLRATPRYIYIYIYIYCVSINIPEVFIFPNFSGQFHSVKLEPGIYFIIQKH